MMVYVNPGERVEVVAPYSEACLAMRVAGTRMLVELLVSRHGFTSAQLYTVAGERFSAPVLPGEAGLFRDDQDRYYFFRAGTTS